MTRTIKMNCAIEMTWNPLNLYYIIKYLCIKIELFLLEMKEKKEMYWQIIRTFLQN